MGPYDGPIDATNTNRQYVAYAIAAASTATTVTATLSASVSAFSSSCAFAEYAGMSTVQPFDVAAGGAGNAVGTDSAATAPITTTGPNELIFGFVIDGSVSAGAGFTTRGTDFADLTEDQIAPTPGTYRATATPTGDWIATVVAFHSR